MFEFNPRLALLTGVLYLLFSLYLYRQTKYINNKNYILHLIIYVVLTVCAFYGDYWHYKEHIYILSYDSEAPIGIENIYIQIAKICNFNYPLWRFLVWGCGIFCIFHILKNCKLNNNTSVFFIFSVYYWLYSYTRSAVAVTVFTLGIILVFSPKKPLWKTLFGILICCSSYFLHKSQIIALAILPCGFIKINRKVLIVSLLLIPIAINIVDYIYSNPIITMLFNGSSSSYYDFDLLQNQLENQFEYSRYSGFNLSRIFSIAIDLAKYFLFLYVIYMLSYKRLINSVEPYITRLYGVMYAMLYIGVTFALAGYSNATLSYRLINMAFFPAVLIVLYLYNNAYCSPQFFKRLAISFIVVYSVKEICYGSYCLLLA